MEQRNTSTTRTSPYTKKLVTAAACDILEQEGCPNYDCEDGVLYAAVQVYGNPSDFVLRVEDWLFGTRLTVQMVRPAQGLSSDGELRAVNFLADRIEQYLENEWKIKALLGREIVGRDAV